MGQRYCGIPEVGERLRSPCVDSSHALVAGREQRARVPPTRCTELVHSGRLGRPRLPE